MSEGAAGAMRQATSFADEAGAGLDRHLRQFLATAARYVFPTGSAAPPASSRVVADPEQPEK